MEDEKIMDRDTQSDDTENDEKATDGTEADGCSCMQSHDVDMDMFRSMYADDRYNEYPEGITLNEFKQLVVVETAEMLKKSALTDQDVEARMLCGGDCLPRFTRSKKTCNRLLLEGWPLASYQPTCIMTALQRLSTCCRDMLK
ncbi:hypothetical protein C7M84_010354 [Penaeus vannamei]|uniref:Uncharacterized protein n=1 Tax=Penaeus vannamei TaxID=6689 RepID=A0A3R7Q449_PENVA|nr:uncharacterized protein LOC113812297 [Penaeus vannamei]ROT85612.1 hypothetical protein C7M84_010354 [Penaeus vannamei]